jgi:hypothetical protein
MLDGKEIRQVPLSATGEHVNRFDGHCFCVHPARDRLGASLCRLLSLVNEARD